MPLNKETEIKTEKITLHQFTRCKWRDDYHRRKLIRQAKFKSWISLFSFHFMQTPLVNAWNFLKSSSLDGFTCGATANVLNYDIEVSEFELQSRYDVCFLTNTHGKGMNPTPYIYSPCLNCGTPIRQREGKKVEEGRRLAIKTRQSQSSSLWKYLMTLLKITKCFCP